MKKLFCVVMVLLILFTASIGTFACTAKTNFKQLSPKAPAKTQVSKTDFKQLSPQTSETSAKIQAAKTAFSAEVAPLYDSLKTLFSDLKKAKSANPVDQAAIKSIKDKIAAVNKTIMDKQIALNNTINNIKLVAQYGADAVAKMDAAKAAFDKDVAPLKEKLKTLNSNLKTAKSANPVDKTLVKSIKDQINSVNADIMAKQKALNSTIERIKLVATYGEETVVKIEAAKAAFEKDVAPLKEKLKTLNSNLKAAKDAKPVDQALVKSILGQIFSVNGEIMAKTKALNETIKKLKTPITAKAV